MLVKNYSNVARIYAHLMRSIDYKMWAKYIFNLSRITKKKNLSVLELACGSGDVAGYLLRKFDDYTLCDLSLQMLISFDHKFVNKINCDITALPFKQKYDFIFSTFDSVNYLLTKTAFIKMLNSVDSCLDQNGIFTFDVSLEENSLRNLKYLNRKGEFQGIKYQQISSFNRAKKIHQNKFVITREDGSSVTENHRQRVFSFEDYFEMIAKTNLYAYGCYETFSFSNASPKSERAQFVLKKRN
ncbi:MAG: class I SAM-dependent methyltransferase [Ignavibacteria bacterium]|nr:class I SAM-dependent methyltransferase [Ignavibacteria bacterium]